MTRMIGLAAVVAVAMWAAPEARGADCGSCSAGYAAKDKGRTIVVVAKEAGSFSTLLAAAKAAGLVDTLKGAGPFTVFAPTDDAFAKLPSGTVENLLKPENKDKLAAILKYHVVSGRVMAADVKAGEVATVNGQKLTVTVGADGVRVDNAKVVKTDVNADNGVIHVIDAVVLPKS